MVQGSFEYLKRLELYRDEKPYEILVPMSLFSKSDIPRTNLVFEDVSVDISDVRGRQDSFSLDANGFAWAKHDIPSLDLTDREVVEQKYIPEIKSFLERELPDAKKIFSFDWRVRRSISQDEFSKRTVDLGDGLDALLPAIHPHVDQSKTSAVNRVRMHMGDEAEELLKGRVRIINVWRPLKTVVAWPLALCDAQSVSNADLVEADIIRRKYIGETWFGAYNPNHRWHYLSAQNPDEVTMIKIFDSSPSADAKFCLHSSFQAVPDAALQIRESIEVRSLVFSDD